MADDAGAFAEELTTVFTEEDDCTAFADELAGFVAELLTIFTEDEDGGTVAELAVGTAEDFGTAADELLASLAELLSAFAEEEIAVEAGFAAEEDKYLPGACTEEELVRTM